jgi:site-specific DNA recombinase
MTEMAETPGLIGRQEPAPPVQWSDDDDEALIPSSVAEQVAAPARTTGMRAATVSGPSGLSDYAVSPLGMPAALLQGEVRVAFLGRTSTEDQQDPRQSMIRQYDNCRSALPEAWVIVAHFYDVESGRMDLDARGRGEDYGRFAIPIARDGGVTDLMIEAQEAGRRFDVVICESVSRVARRAYEGLTVERALERCDVVLFASNEPITVSGSRAQRILQRRINQSIAEYEVLNTLEQSWGGLCTHTREGFNIGKPPYGYRAKLLRHPNPAKAARGHTKTRLEPDGARAETVAQIAQWRYHEGLGYATIAERLNTDLTRYPPPEPPGGAARARGAWGKSTVYEILRNPKYTGYMVFNRRASRSRAGAVNDPIKWVWSPEPTHPPLIAKWMYDAYQAASRARQGSRAEGADDVRAHVRRSYLLRGLLFCQCGRRMNGNHRRGLTWYLCWPRGNNRGRTDLLTGHPKTVYLNEAALLEAISDFYNQRVFGPDRRALLDADLAGRDDHAATQRRTDRARLQRVLADLTRRQEALIRQAQDGDPNDPYAKALRANYNSLEKEKNTTRTALAELDTADATDPHQHPSPDAAALLDALPVLRANLAHAPQPLLRDLFESTKLTVTLAPDDPDTVTISITLPGDTIDTISHTAGRITDDHAPDHDETARHTVAEPVRAPGGARTCDVPPAGREPAMCPRGGSDRFCDGGGRTTIAPGRGPGQRPAPETADRVNPRWSGSGPVSTPSSWPGVVPVRTRGR